MVIITLKYRKLIAIQIPDRATVNYIKEIPGTKKGLYFDIGYSVDGKEEIQNSFIEHRLTIKKSVGTTQTLNESQYKELGIKKQPFIHNGKLQNYVLISTRNERQPLTIQDNGYTRNIGEILGDTFYKKVRRSEHLYRELNAWGIDGLFFKGKISEECFNIKILDTETDTMYKTTVGKYKQYGEYRTYKPHRTQILLPLSYFEVTEDYAANKLRNTRS